VEVQSLTRKSKTPSLHRSGPMACGIDHMPEVFEALCAAPGEKVQEFNLHDISNTLWAIAETGTHMLEVFEALCAAPGENFEKVQEFNSHSLGHCQDRHAHAGGLLRAVRLHVH